MQELAQCVATRSLSDAQSELSLQTRPAKDLIHLKEHNMPRRSDLDSDLDQDRTSKVEECEKVEVGAVRRKPF